MKILSILGCVLLCSCSTIAYEEPESGDRARVRLITDSKSITVVRGYSSEACDDETELMRLKVGTLINSSPKVMGMPLWNYDKNAAKEFYFLANEEKYFMFFGARTIGGNTYSCAVPIAVKFAPNKDYELNYKSGLTSCSIELFELTSSNGNYERKLLNTYGNIGSDGCSSALRKSRWY